MALLNKQDSNFTALSYAAEASPGVLPGTPVWNPLEPNDYKSFGGNVTTKARKPINPSRQLKKGVVVDLVAEGGFHQDITALNLQDLAQYFFFANLRTKSELTPVTVDQATHAYFPAAGGTAYQAGDLLFAKNLTNTVNNGLKVVSGTPGNTSIVVTDTGLLQETAPTNAVISRVGYQFGTTELSLSIVGGLPKLASNGAYAGVIGTTTGVFSNGDTVTIGGVAYTFQTVLTTGVANNVLIGASATVSLANLKNAINRDTINGVPDVDFSAATVQNPFVSAVSGASTITLTARLRGTSQNTIATIKTAANFSWASATLLGGTGRDLATLGLVTGEYVYIGDDAAGNSFANAANFGYARCLSIDTTGIVFDKTQNTLVADAGTGKTVRIYIGRALKNESVQANVIRKSLQLERSLGYTDDALQTQIQGEYVTRCYGNQLEIDGKTGDILVADYSFLGGTYESRASATGLKSGTRPAIVDSDAFNTTSNVAFMRMMTYNPTNSNPTPLFAYLTDFKMLIKNNLKTNKAVSVLGAFDVTAGFFEVTYEVTAYFQNVAAIQSVINNDDITAELHFTKANKGLSIDLPLLALSKGLADIKQNEPVTLPLGSTAATASKLSANLNHTCMMIFWDYLPTIAH